MDLVTNSAPKGLTQTQTAVTAEPNWTTTEESMPRARAWLDQCLGTHRQCIVNSTSEAWYPSRLLRLTRTSEDVKIRLQDCRDEAPSGRYITLSHRWANAKFLTLTTENIEEMKRDIPFNGLPKTFQHAVQVTLD